MHTPVEILVILIVLAIFMALAGPGLLQVRQRAQDNQRDYRLKTLGLAMSNYHETYSSFPASPPTKKSTAAPKKAPSQPVELVSPF